MKITEISVLLNAIINHGIIRLFDTLGTITLAFILLMLGLWLNISYSCSLELASPEIISDQGTDFMSQLLKELCNLLHINQIQTSPYHPQTNGLVERFNKTLKAMLRKLVSKEGKIGIDCCHMCCLHIVKLLSQPQDFHCLNCCMVEK